jgi:hypothetical protein
VSAADKLPHMSNQSGNGMWGRIVGTDNRGKYHTIITRNARWRTLMPWNELVTDGNGKGMECFIGVENSAKVPEFKSLLGCYISSMRP